MTDRGVLLVISGPSGTGKGTVISELFSREENLFFSVSATTRAPRPHEVEGEHYSFLQFPEFERAVAAGEMLEYTEYNGNLYGTPRANVERELAAGHDVVLDIEVNGAAQVRKLFPEAALLFLMPPSREELRRRLEGRGTESREVIEGRLAMAEKEIALADTYDYIVINDHVERAAERVSHILKAERCRSRQLKTFLSQFF